MVCHLPPFVSIDLNPLVVGTNDATIIIKLVKAMESSCGFVVLVAVVVVAVLVVVVQRDNVAVEAGVTHLNMFAAGRTLAGSSWPRPSGSVIFLESLFRNRHRKSGRYASAKTISE